MGIRLHEPAVALTDLAIGLESATFAHALVRQRARCPRPTGRAAESARWFVVFFASTSVAALAGAALHGLFPPGGTSPGRRWLWRVSLGSIGVAGLSGWCLGATFALPREEAQRVRRAAMAVHLLYLVGLARTNPPYRVAIVVYLPGTLALGAGLVSGLRDSVTRGASAIALVGLGLTFGAAAAQMRKIAVHPRLFDHNATYHTIQAIAVGCFFAAARRFLQADGRR